MVFIIPMLAVIVSSCSPDASQVNIPTQQTISPTGLLTPFYTFTPVVETPTPTAKITIPVTPSPTATPFLHTLTNDDTLLGLAFRYGVSLEDLMAANPGVDSHYLTPGKQIVIPIDSGITETLPTATPIPLDIEQLQCYSSGDGGAWCIAGLHNATEASLENLSVGIGLYSPEGETIASEVAYAPLDILRPDQTMPLMAYFAPPLPDEFLVQGQVLSGLVIAEDDGRYLDLQANVDQVEISGDGRQATISGEVVLTEQMAAPSQLWLLAVAYDANGDIIGARKWKSASEAHFEITVYSLAGTIDHIELLLEARP